MTRLAHLLSLLAPLFASLLFAILTSAAPLQAVNSTLAPRFVQPSGAPDVCFDSHHCLTVQTIDGALGGVTNNNGCKWSQFVDHSGYNWRSYVYDGPCAGLVELSCLANATTGLAARGLVQFGFAAEPPVGGVSASYLTSESPIVLGEAWGETSYLDPTYRLGTNKIEVNQRAWVQWIVWCKLWGH